jgi:hypothetical protein
MRRYALFLTAALLAAPALRAQSDSATVVGVVTHFFDGMRTRDTGLMRSTVVPDAVLRSVSGPTKLGDPTPVAQFITRVGSGTGPGANEQIKDPKVSIDGPMASLWAYYTLTRDGKLNHCGVDLFLLRHGADGWRIYYVSDTRRTEGCTPI